MVKSVLINLFSYLSEMGLPFKTETQQTMDLTNSHCWINKCSFIGWVYIPFPLRTVIYSANSKRDLVSNYKFYLDYLRHWYILVFCSKRLYSLFSPPTPEKNIKREKKSCFRSLESWCPIESTKCILASSILSYKFIYFKLHYVITPLWQCESNDAQSSSGGFVNECLSRWSHIIPLFLSTLSQFSTLLSSMWPSQWRKW